MNDDRTVDRRSILRRASAAGLAGIPGVGSLWSHGRQGSDGQDDGEQDGPIRYMQAVLPARTILEEGLVYRIIVVGGPITPHERPPPKCFPEGEDEWVARNALVVKPTETGVFEGEDIGAVNRNRIHLEQSARVGSVWRISGGTYCDGNAQVTIHELPPQLSEYFSKEMLDMIEQVEREGTAANVTVGNETAGNESDLGR